MAKDKQHNVSGGEWNLGPVNQDGPVNQELYPNWKHQSMKKYRWGQVSRQESFRVVDRVWFRCWDAVTRGRIDGDVVSEACWTVGGDRVTPQ